MAMKEDVAFTVETKSHNLKTFADELLGFLNSLTMSIDHFHNDLVKLVNLAIFKRLNHAGQEKSSVLNLQVGHNSKATTAATFLSAISSNLDQIPKSIPYDDQVKNKELLDAKQQEIERLHKEIAQLKKINIELMAKLKEVELASSKHQTIGKMMKDKWEKTQDILNNAVAWSSSVMKSILEGESES